MLRYRTQGLLAAGFGFAVAACSSPEIKTDLRPAGAPEVLSVLAQSQIDLIEDAVYCKYVNGTLDPKAPAFVGDPLTGGHVVCPPTEAEFEPLGASNFGFGIRVMFDELLNGDRVETLDCDLDDDGETDDPLVCQGSLDATQPLTITCMNGGSPVELDYTGYYVPNGNRVTFPVGPSIYALPDTSVAPFPTGTACTLTIEDNVVDKTGDAVPADQRTINFNMQDLALVAVDPSPGAVVSPLGAAAFIFNAPMDDGSLDAATEVELTTAAGAAVPYDAVIDDGLAFGDAIYVFPTGTWRPGDYSARIRPGASFAEVNGGTIEFAAEEKVDFSVSFNRIGTAPSSNGTIATTGTLTIFFNDPIDPASVTEEEFELVDFNNQPVGFSVAVITDDAGIGNDAIEITPDAPLMPTNPDGMTPNRRYNLRVKAAASFSNTGPNGPKTFRGPFTLTFRVM